MRTQVTITIKPEEEKNPQLIKTLIFRELNKNNIPFEKDRLIYKFEKKSIDARHGRQKFHLRYQIYIDENPEDSENLIPKWKHADDKHKVIIIGAGPAGLFGALKLLEYGIKPVILERGTETSQRRKDIALISTQDFVNPDSNYCFGEGGAGTFSDGKLYTRSNKRGNINSILQIFAIFGADKKILTDTHAHIGTDKLPGIINNMRKKILESGGEIHFNTKVVDFILEEDSGKNKKITGVKAVTCNGGQRETVNNTNSSVSGKVSLSPSETALTFYGDAVVLATGHSATDIYKLIGKHSPSSLEAKTFAAGVRVEHPRALIDSIQYHGKKDENLPTAEYRVTTQVEGRGVYSFCMCPGGFVVPSASGPDEIVVNGMSTAARNSRWSNAAIVVEIRPEDIPEKFVKKAEEFGCPSIAGLLFRKEIETLAKKNGKGQAAPAQRLTDFLNSKVSLSLPDTSYTPGVVPSDLNTWMPEHIISRLHKGFLDIDKNMHGYICEDAVMIAPETRTSTPVRIARDTETFQCIGIQKLFPAGEGSGYSGGIVSSAMDGVKICEYIAKTLN